MQSDEFAPRARPIRDVTMAEAVFHYRDYCDGAILKMKKNLSGLP
jgi:hypothetical protein